MTFGARGIGNSRPDRTRRAIAWQAAMVAFARMVTAVLLGCGLTTSAVADDRLISRFFADHTAEMLLIDPAEGWIDDFGTGYSSLSYLKRLPVTELKIGQSFVSGLPDDAADKALINIIDAAAQQFQLRVVAEGVETQKHADFFRDKPDMILQGYWFDKPSEIHSWMRKWWNNRG